MNMNTMKIQDRKRTHYYILPDGRRVENMKEACEAMGIGRRAAQSLIKKEVIKKILI